MEVSAQKVVDKLRQQISDLIYQNALLQAQLEAKQQEIDKLKDGTGDKE